MLATDRRLVTDLLSLQHMHLGKSNQFLQEIRLRADQLIVRRQPKAASRRIGAWVWRDESLASTCLARVMHATASYLATCPSHVHEYAPRNLETARFPVELEKFSSTAVSQKVMISLPDGASRWCPLFRMEKRRPPGIHSAVGSFSLCNDDMAR